jgi:hypothetical protein
MTDFEETVKRFFEKKEKGWRKTDIPFKKKLLFDQTLRNQLENELKTEFLKFAKGYSEQVLETFLGDQMDNLG